MNNEELIYKNFEKKINEAFGNSNNIVVRISVGKLQVTYPSIYPHFTSSWTLCPDFHSSGTYQSLQFSLTIQGHFPVSRFLDYRWDASLARLGALISYVFCTSNFPQ